LFLKRCEDVCAGTIGICRPDERRVIECEIERAIERRLIENWTRDIRRLLQAARELPDRDASGVGVCLFTTFVAKATPLDSRRPISCRKHPWRDRGAVDG